MTPIEKHAHKARMLRWMELCEGSAVPWLLRWSPEHTEQELRVTEQCARAKFQAERGVSPPRLLA